MTPANDNFLKADVANLLAEVDALFAAFPELADDEQLRADMLEGSTSAFDVLTRLLNQEREADSLAKAIASRMSDLSARRQRAERKKDAMRVLMLRIMTAAGIQKAPLVEATVSVSKGRDSVEIVDEAKLPRWAYETVRKPLKAEIKERLDAGKKVAGAAIKTGEATISVRAS